MPLVIFISLLQLVLHLLKPSKICMIFVIESRGYRLDSKMWRFARHAALLLQREFVQQLIDGVETVIEMEKALEEGKSIDDLVAAIM